ncbi:cilia- and flagella-associated protein 184 [Hyperolius riggenbachi]|uniref:cilia- and flagella-associated protein 184 n=1 Tax=Hyperolius riggenbachi TaxID=752182 RepID=UPI0035A372CE
MQSPEPGAEVPAGTEAERSATGQGTGTEPINSDKTDREHGGHLEAGNDSSTHRETSREQSVHQEANGEHGSHQDAGREHDANQETEKEYAAQQETGEQNVNQVTEKEYTAHQETDGEPGISEGMDGEHSTNLEAGSEAIGREPGTSQETGREQNANQEAEKQSVPDRDSGMPDQETERELGSGDDTGAELGTIEVAEEQDVREEFKTMNQETASSELQQQEFGSTSVSESTEFVHPAEEQEKIGDIDNELVGTAAYQEMTSEPSEEQTSEYLMGQVNEESMLEVEGEQWQQEEDISGATAEDEAFKESLIQQYHAVVSEKEKVHQQNSQLQHKLYEYFRKKRGEETRPETEKQVADQEQRYLKYLATLEEMRKKFQIDATLHQQQIEELRTQCQKVENQVDKEWSSFQEQQKKMVLYIVNRGAGKHAASSFNHELEQLQSREERKEKEVIQVRLENIKLKNQIQRYESTMRSKEELAEGLHLIDFEQLKIENQTYNEKIEERNEELLKLRKKITNTVQVLTHVKEKLQFVQAENQEQKDKLMEIDALVAHRRDILTKTKQARDSLRMDNLNLKQKSGLLGNKILLRDFEDKVDATEELSQKLENLKRRHAELTLSSRGIMKKIDEAKLVMES